MNKVLTLLSTCLIVLLTLSASNQATNCEAPRNLIAQAQKCCKYCSSGKACGDTCISANYTCSKPPGCACDGPSPSPSPTPQGCKEEINLNPTGEMSSRSGSECKDFLISVKYHDGKCGFTGIKTAEVRGSVITAVSTSCTACNPPRSSFSIYADGKVTGISNVAQIVSVTCAAKKPSRKACDTAIKLLTQYERLAAKYDIKISKKRLEELNRKRDNETITVYDLPAGLRELFPGELKGYNLKEIRDLCK